MLLYKSAPAKVRSAQTVLKSAQARLKSAPTVFKSAQIDLKSAQENSSFPITPVFSMRPFKYAGLGRNFCSFLEKQEEV
jgi:hypothetical protein